MSTHGVSFHRQSWFDQLCEDLCWDQVQSGKLSFRDALVAAEQKAQTSWAQTILADLIPQGREVLFLSGNHDFIRVGDILGKKQIWPDFVEIGNHRFAGFPHVTYANGDYNHETQDRRSPVSQAFYAEPTILVTHIPPQGILSDEFGCSSLSSALAYSSHKIQAHLFGHCHRTCGVTTEDGILFSNAATMGRILEI
jgi:Icc-related predicted phosphoesterase